MSRNGVIWATKWKIVKVDFSVKTDNLSFLLRLIVGESTRSVSHPSTTLVTGDEDWTQLPIRSFLDFGCRWVMTETDDPGMTHKSSTIFGTKLHLTPLDRETSVGMLHVIRWMSVYLTSEITTLIWRPFFRQIMGIHNH